MCSRQLRSRILVQRRRPPHIGERDSLPTQGRKRVGPQAEPRLMSDSGDTSNRPDLNHLARLFSELEEHNARQGQSTLAERKGLETVLASSPASCMQLHMALAAARALSILRQVAPVELPLEVLAAIAEKAVPPIFEDLECCQCQRANGSPGTMQWGVAMPPAADSSASPCAVCTTCFRVRAATVRPRVCLGDAGDGWPLRGVTVSSGPPRWKACRHFHWEEGGRDAVRHRMSGLHSFRTVVCSEWVLGGAVSYEIAFPRLASPCSAGVGVVTPYARVNADTAWCAGTRGWAHSWGLCVEPHVGDGDEEAAHVQMRAIPSRFSLGPSGQSAVARAACLAEAPRGGEDDDDDEMPAPAPVPSEDWEEEAASEEEEGSGGDRLLTLSEGDSLIVTVDASERTLTITHRPRTPTPIPPTPIHLKLDISASPPARRGGLEYPPAQSAGLEYEVAQRMQLQRVADAATAPLALAVALKYAADTCHLVRRLPSAEGAAGAGAAADAPVVLSSRLGADIPHETRPPHARGGVLGVLALAALGAESYRAEAS